MDEEMVGIMIMERMNWTYQDYCNTPKKIIEHILLKWRVQAKTKK